jgi:hypothetical protein
MALTEKQKKIFKRGMRLREDRNDPDSKSFFQILNDVLNPTNKNALFAAIKDELIRRLNRQKDAKQADIDNIKA